MTNTELVLNWFKSNKKIKATPKQIALELGFSESAYISYALKVLLKKQMILKEGYSNQIKYYYNDN